MFATASDARPVAGPRIPIAEIDATDPLTDSDATSALARREGARWVVCDGHRFDAAYVRRLRGAGLHVLRIVDDPGEQTCEADILLDQNIGAEGSAYQVRSGTRVLLGIRYALIREAILRHGRASRTLAKVRRIIVLTGGADVAALAPRFVRAFRSVAEAPIRCDVVIGPASRSAELAIAAAQGDERIAMHVDPPDPGALMASADLALSAGGTTCWELCYLGSPMVLVAAAENQRRITTGLASAGAAVDLGWHEDLTDDMLARALVGVLRDGYLRVKLAARSRTLVDGRGGDRVVAILREATPK